MVENESILIEISYDPIIYVGSMGVKLCLISEKNQLRYEDF